MRRVHPWIGLLALQLGCSITVAWPADIPSAPGRWTEDQCKEAIRTLIGEPDYPLALHYVGKVPSAPREVEAHFRGRETVKGAPDLFYVCPDRHLVDAAFLASREDRSYFAFGADTFRKATADPVAAEALARSVAEAHCPQLLAEPFTYTKRLDTSPYGFTWEGVAQPWGVRIPFRRLYVEVDARTGLFCGWMLSLDDVVIDPKPRMTAEQAMALVRREVHIDPVAQVTAEAAVVGLGKQQRIVWHVRCEVPDRSCRIYLVRDRSGWIEGCI